MKAASLGRILILFFLPLCLFAELSFKLETTKEQLYLNQTIKATLTLSVPKDIILDEMDLDEFRIDDFWMKEFKRHRPIETNAAWVYAIECLLEPKAPGVYTLPVHTAYVSNRQIRRAVRREKIQSNEVTLTVLPLFENLPIQGSYTIEASVDKAKVQANKPLNYTITVTGSGNLKDITPFELGLTKQLVFADQPQVDAVFKGSAYEGKFVQKYSILADQSFTIPSLRLTYFNIQNNRVETISSEPFFIEVEGKNPAYRDHYSLKYVFGVTGIALGILVIALLKRFPIRRPKDDTPLVRKIRKSKTDKELYDLLLPYSKQESLSSTMKLLEENLFFNGAYKIERDEVARVVEEEEGFQNRE